MANVEQPAVFYSLLTTHYSLLTTHYSPFAIRHSANKVLNNELRHFLRPARTRIRRVDGGCGCRHPRCAAGPGAKPWRVDALRDARTVRPGDRQPLVYARGS